MNETEMKKMFEWHRDRKTLGTLWQRAVDAMPHKIIVLDDDPTGIQTIADVAVYTQWNKRIIRHIDSGNQRVTFVWTNSRALPTDAAERLYRQIATDLLNYYKRTGTEFTIICRGDSTLRGNYPQETRAFFDVWAGTLSIDAEIIAPYFPQAGRYTFGDIHYVSQNGTLVPCAQTEFAKDKTFGYTSSDIKEWIKEKHGGQLSSRIFSVPIESLRSADDQSVVQTLTEAKGFDKIVVNAIDTDDLRAFVVALSQAAADGKRYIFRTAASFVNAIGGIAPKEAYIQRGCRQNGLFIVGSHTALTTAQVENLLGSGVHGIEIAIADVFSLRAMRLQRKRIKTEVKKRLGAGQSVCIMTPRQYQSFPGKSNLQIARAVSDEITAIARMLRRYPDYIVAKGGITSHDIAVRGLGIKKAVVLGQVLDGVPVIRSEKHRRPIIYTIFPGNVGTDAALVRIKEKYESGCQDGNNQK